MTDLAYTIRAPRRLWREAFTPQQATCVELVAQGMSNREIAAVMYVTEQTVKFHLSDAYKSVSVTSRMRAARWWWENVEMEMLWDEMAADQKWRQDYRGRRAA